MKKRIISFLLVLCMVAAMLPVTALAAGSGTMDAPWTSNSVKVSKQGSTLLVYGTGAMADYADKTAPEWYSVSGNITKIVIEDSVTKLGANAFAACGNVTTIQLKRGIAIGSNLDMASTALPTVGNVELEVIGSGYMPDYDSNQPWANFKTRITKVFVNEGVQSIGAQAFSGCTKLQSIIIPGSAAYIGKEAFANCVSLTDVKLYHDFGSNGTYPFTIGNDAFPVGNAGFNIALEITGATAVPDYADADAQPWANLRPYITSLVVDGDVPRIGNNAFSGCKWLKSISFYFNEHSAKAQKVFGRDTFKYEGNKTLNVVAASEALAFDKWTGATFAAANNENTQVYYNAQGMTVVANWLPVVRNLVLEPKTDMAYGDVELGYKPLNSYTVEVTNKGNVNSGNLLIELSGGYPNAFVLNTQNIPSLVPGGKATFSVTPANGMDIGGYFTTVIVSDAEGTIATFTVSFDVGNAYSRAARFVKRLYTCALGRAPEAVTPEEIDAYVQELLSGKSTAASTAAAFFTSAEFRARGLSNADFVNALYTALLDRVPSAPERNNWVNALNAGTGRNSVFGSFITSEEFKNICARDTIPVGTVNFAALDMTNSVAASTAAKDFVKRLYKKVLDREPDDEGLNHWATALTNGKLSAAEVAIGFFSSEEYTAKKKSNLDFATDLYWAMLDRAPDAPGLEHWVTKLANGTTRATVFNGFCTATEFNTLCTGYGFAAGAINPAKYNIQSFDDGKEIAKVTDAVATAAVTELYKAILGRTPDTEGLANNKAALMSGNATHAQMAASLFASPEGIGRGLTDEQFVTALYQALLGRDPNPAEVVSNKGTLGSGTTRAALFVSVANSQEYKNRCSAKGYSWGNIDPAKYPMDLPKPTIVVTEANATAFVVSCYQKALKRDPGAGEADGWINEMVIGKQSAAQVAAGILSSGEFKGHGLSDVDFVKVVYQVLLGRGASDGEAASWASALTAGATRSQVFNEILKSQECIDHCKACGFSNGSINPGDYNMG